MEANQVEDQNYRAAKKRVNDIKGFYIHLIVYLFINGAILLVNSNFNQNGFLDLEVSNFYTAIFWGIGLGAHWASVFGPSFILGKNWEERKIRELMEKDRKQMQKWE